MLVYLRSAFLEHKQYLQSLFPLRVPGVLCKNSADTLQAIWQGREEQVAEGIRQAHFETSHLQYNDENALSYTISLAMYLLNFLML